MNSVQSRRASRLILLDEQRRVLLFRHLRRDGTSLWAPPGGGVEASETFEQAAAREAAEELGLRDCPLTFLWEGAVEFTYVDHSVRQQERFFLLDGDVKQFPATTRNFRRREGIAEMRWWSVDEIKATSEQVFPEDLASELGKIWRGAPVSRSITTKQSRQRVDVALVERGLASTRERAQAMIMAGQVRIGEQVARKPSEMVAGGAEIFVSGAESKYASRAGMKLEGALEDFQVDVAGRICLDIGSSNGGFTDCLLQHGAARVYAVDVNTKQLDWKLQRDERVHAIEKNARYLRAEDIPERADLITMDVSFISVTKILAAVASVARADADFLILAKPQFELAKNLVGKGGIVHDAALHERAIAGVREAAEKCGLRVLGVQASRVTGAEGNQEFFLHARSDSIQSSESHGDD